MKTFSGNIFINGEFKKGYLSFSKRISGISFSKRELGSHEIENFSDYYIVPGFIDLHTNGANGVSFIDSCKDIDKFLSFTYSQGITTSLPTFIGTPLDRLEELLKQLDFSRVEGIHLEGPFISAEKAGIHKYIEPFNLSYLKRVAEIIPSHIKVLFTYAPEEVKDSRIFSFAEKNKWIFSCGHSNMGYLDTTRIIKKGVKSATHLFNAMSGLHHRDGGIALAFLNSKNTYIQLIPDGIHVSLEMIELIKRLKAYKQIIVVTDNLPMIGLEDGNYKWGHHLVEKKGLTAFINNRLAGSLVDTKRIFEVLQKTGFTLAEIIAMRSEVPAKLMGFKHIGSLKKGNYADFILLSKKMKIVNVFKRGEKVF